MTAGTTTLAPPSSPEQEPAAAAALSPFVARHVGPDADAVAAMLEVVGQPSLEALVDAAIPGSIRADRELRIEAAPSEQAVVAELRALAARNTVLRPMIGLGYHGTITPPVVQRNVLENPAWYTAYTPYQPEISQGRLEALINFQTVVSDLTGLPISGASLLDESTAAAEAMTLMRRMSKSPSDAVLVVDAYVLPQTIAVIRTRAQPLEIPVVVADLTGLDSAQALRDVAGDRDVYGVILQYPGADGQIRDGAAVAAAAHEHGALVTAAADLLALTLITPPGEWGADIAVGSSQRFGVPMGFGGPHAGFMAVRQGLERSMPGRLVGVSVDSDGHPAYRLALQTREQHIRREKATSNICTAQVLLAVMAGMYAVWHGPDGLAAIARRVHGYARTLAEGLHGVSAEVLTTSYFDTLTVRVPGRAQQVLAEAAARGVNLHLVDADTLSMSVDETTTGHDLHAVWSAFGVPGVEPEPSTAGPVWAGVVTRTSDYLTHPVFHTHRSETQMLRYLRRLADRDFALDRGMIPLGSCTMKLNATTEMLAVTWPEFAELHPFAPTAQTEGIRELVADLSAWLCEITGYDAVSLQPNAGSQGEFAGLLAIHAYHQATGQGHRRVCLIPASAHGTNAASAVMAGLKVVVVRTAEGATSTSTTCGPRSSSTATTWPRSWSPTPPPTASTRTPSASCVPSCTTPAVRSTSTGRTSTRSWAWRSRASSGPTSRTSTCTRPSASRTVAAAPGSVRSPSGRTWRRSCPTTRWLPRPVRRPGSGPWRAPPTARRASCRSRGPTCG